MSSPATPAYLAAFRNKATRAICLLAKIELAIPSAVTLRVAQTETILPDGTVWEGGLHGGVLSADLDRLGTGPNPCDITIRLDDRIYPFMASGVVTNTLSTYQWQGAAVTLYTWNDVRNPVTGAQVLSASDLLQEFSGVVDSFSTDDTGLILNLLQSGSHNKPIPTTTIDKISYPNAPDVSQGRPVPIVYGDHGALPMRSPWTSAFGTSKQRQEDSGAGLGVIPMFIVDPGLGAANVKVVAASHACVKLLDRANGYTPFIVGSDVLAPLDTTGLSETLGAAESFITINDDALVAYCAILPVDARGTFNLADNPRRATDPFDETTFATLNQALTKGVLELQLPSVGSLGFIEAVEAVIAFSGDAANANPIRVSATTPGGAATAAITSSLGQSQTTTPQVLVGTWPAAFWNQSWQFGGSTPGTPWDIKVDFTGGATNKARVYWVALRVKFRPQRSLVTPAFYQGKVIGASSPSDSAPVPWASETFLKRHPFSPASFSFSGQFFGNVKGYADDGSGTYTGTIGALIQRPCDIVRHLLAVYGGVASFETGTTEFGSFVRARSLLRNAAPGDYRLACWIGEKTSVQQAVQAVAEQSLMCVYQDRFTGKWLSHVWRRGGDPDYDLTFDLESIASIEAGVESDVQLAQGVRVKWGFDHFKGRSLFETFVNAAGSSQGYEQPTVIDQQLVVSAANNKLDWTNSGTWAATLANATYHPIDLASEIQAKMRAQSGGIETVGYGFVIKAGFNDTWVITRSAVPYNVVFNPGSYDADALAREFVRAATAAAIPGTTFTAVYSHATNLFDVTSGVTVTWGNFFPMGFASPGSGTAKTSVTACYADRFYFANFTGTLKWLTGANVAANCAELVGFTRLADQAVAPGAALPQVFALLARGERQTACAASEAEHGPRQDRVIDAPWVRDESSGQQLRDRIFDFGSNPPTWVRVVTHDAPDLQRFRIVQFSAAVVARRRYPEYGTDGSWANKPFRVLKIKKDLDKSFHTEFYAEKA